MVNNILKFSKKHLNWLWGNPECWAMVLYMMLWFVCGAGIVMLAGSIIGIAQNRVLVAAGNAGSFFALIPGMLGWLYWRINAQET